LGNYIDGLKCDNMGLSELADDIGNIANTIHEQPSNETRMMIPNSEYNDSENIILSLVCTHLNRYERNQKSKKPLIRQTF
jgi:hypothetical protein